MNYIQRDLDIKKKLYPSRTNSRYYAAIQLRNGLCYVADKYLRNSGVKNAILVDLGCGIKPYETILKPYVVKHIGVDLPGNELADAFINANGEAELQPGLADIVLSNQVLEHVAGPNLYLQECNRILKKDGLLILSTHGYWKFHPDPVDYWRWTSEGLKKIITEGGFAVIEVYGLMGLSATSMQLFQDSINKRIPRSLKPFFFFIMQACIQFFDKNNSRREKNQDSCFYYVVARKI